MTYHAHKKEASNRGRTLQFKLGEYVMQGLKRLSS